MHRDIRSMDIKVKKKLLLATCISVALMSFMIKKIDWEHFSLIASRIDLKYLMASCSVFILGNLVRSFRFIQLDHTHNTLTHWWNINAFYNFITANLPGGTGEVATAYVLKRFSMLNMLGAFRILLLSRLMDLFALSALFLVSAILISSLTPYREAAIWLSGTLFLISSVAIIPASEQFFLRLMQMLPGHFALVQKLVAKLSELLIIAKEHRDAGSLPITLLQSLLNMIAGVAMLYLLLRSLGVDFTWMQSFYCYGVYAVFQIIPVQGIAGIGTQAAWWALALNASGYKAPDVIAIGFILYATFYLFIALLGFFSLLAWGKGKKKGLVF